MVEVNPPTFKPTECRCDKSIEVAVEAGESLSNPADGADVLNGVGNGFIGWSNIGLSGLCVVSGLNADEA